MFTLDKKRLVVPRWTSPTNIAAVRPETKNDATPAWSERAKVETQRLYARWARHRRLTDAASLVERAPLLHDNSLLFGPAEHVLSHKGEVETAVYQAAEQIRFGKSSSTRDELTPHLIQRRIGIIRERLRRNPNSPLDWLEIGRLKTVRGQIRQAERDVLNALALSAGHVFVTRSAARYFLHADDPERAHALLEKSPYFETSTLIRSAELALARLAERRPRTLNSRRFYRLDDHPNVFDSELLASIATEELFGGNQRRAKKLFRSASLVTENVAAQVAWASAEFGLGLEDGPRSNVPPSEANARRAFLDSEYNQAFRWAIKWHRLEGFASAPLSFAEHISTVFLENYARSLELLETSRAANPNNATVLNAIAYVQLRRGNISEGEAALRRAITLNEDKELRAVLYATEGLLNYSKGRPVDGDRKYHLALVTAKDEGLNQLSLRVYIHWLEAEFYSGTADNRTLEKLICESEAVFKKNMSRFSILSRKTWETKMGNMKKRLAARATLQLPPREMHLNASELLPLL